MSDFLTHGGALKNVSKLKQWWWHVFSTIMTCWIACPVDIVVLSVLINFVVAEVL